MPWYVIVNTIGEHPELIKRFEGSGPILGSLEWDVRVYFELGGAMYDAAITAWGAKGCYDYVRPVSAIRAMADRGQASDPADPDCLYHVDGLEYVDDPDDPASDGSYGVIDCVCQGDPLADDPYTPCVDALNVGKIKLFAWRGPAHISNAVFDFAGVDRNLGRRLVALSAPDVRDAAVCRLYLGSFDLLAHGGRSEYSAPMNEFLVFEEGPSVDITLEWAKYIDASDQCSLSRLWGGIHPPADDLPGRLIGMTLGPAAFNHARDYFNGIL